MDNGFRYAWLLAKFQSAVSQPVRLSFAWKIPQTTCRYQKPVFIRKIKIRRSKFRPEVVFVRYTIDCVEEYSDYEANYYTPWGGTLRFKTSPILKATCDPWNWYQFSFAQTPVTQVHQVQDCILECHLTRNEIFLSVFFSGTSA